MHKLNKKGQFFSPDLLIGSFIFISALLLFFSTSQSVLININNFELQKQADILAHDSLNYLLLTSGKPENWEYGSLTHVSYIGLSKKPHFLSQQKILVLTEFLDSNYNNTRAIIGTGKFDFYFEVNDSNGSTIVSGGNQVEENVFVYTRPVFYNNKIAIFKGVFSFE